MRHAMRSQPCKRASLSLLRLLLTRQGGLATVAPARLGIAPLG